MNEKRSILDTIATAVSIGFCALGAVVIVTAFRSAMEAKEKMPEHITTSRGRKLFLDTLFFAIEKPSDVPKPQTVTENDASETARPEPA